ncbi:hypothetical protein BDZ97DRAFT_145792 [Flammula alnicola]|nr:hypothetical protein BDZ97DRAFT_145792 [Flammula alnicola]
MCSAPISANCASSRSLLSIWPGPNNDVDKLALSKALVDNGSVDLERLLELQRKVCETRPSALLFVLDSNTQGWHNESIERHFQRQRQVADNASPDLNRIWFQRMKAALREIDEKLCFIPTHEPVEFLDLGCCPGGFSSYMLDKNAEAKGFGVSLPVADGGHEFALESDHGSRFELSYTNLTYYQLGPSVMDDQRLHSLPIEISGRSFDMALLDGHQLRTQISALPWDNDRLLISQLILALQAVKEGGTIMVKLPLPHNPLAAKILYLFSITSERLLRWKPTSMHANRGTFYAVVKGVGRGREASRLPSILLSLKELWVSLTFGGEKRSGRHLVPEDFDFLITTEDLVRHHLDWLMQLGTPLWQVQQNALRRFYQRKDVI